jgi:hypothetical protein
MSDFNFRGKCMKKFVTLCLAIALASFTNVGADTSTSVVAPAAGTSVSSGAASSNANFFSKFKLNLNSNWNGGNFGSIFGKKDSLGNYTTNELAPSIGFKIAPKTTISASATMVTDSNKFSVINAPYLKVAQSGLISIGKFNVDNALRYYPRLTKDIKSAGIHLLFRNDLNSTYSLGSVVTLGCLLSPLFSRHPGNVSAIDYEGPSVFKGPIGFSIQNHNLNFSIQSDPHQYLLAIRR